MELEDVVQEGLGSMVSTEGRMVPHACWELGWGGTGPTGLVGQVAIELTNSGGGAVDVAGILNIQGGTLPCG